MMYQMNLQMQAMTKMKEVLSMVAAAQAAAGDTAIRPPNAANSGTARVPAARTSGDAEVSFRGNSTMTKEDKDKAHMDIFGSMFGAQKAANKFKTNVSPKETDGGGNSSV